MDVLAELRSPTTRLAKALSGLLAVVLFVVFSIATVSGFLIYQILRPARSSSAFDLNVMMGHPAAVSFDLPEGKSREGWFFPGLRGAPTIIVCHGYESQRADVLTLVTALQEHQFNVFLFDFAGHGTSPGVTTLGYEETAELRSAINTLSARDDVDPRHFGLWGEDMGGYVVLEVATSDPRIAAFAVDNAYGDPRDMVQIEVSHSGLAALPLVRKFCDFGFRLVNYRFRHEPPVSPHLGKTRGIPKLFIQTDEHPILASETLQLFIKSPDPKQMVRERQGYFNMSDDDRKAYENQIVSFFLSNLSPTSGH
jgi:pimeloyl-ACP methyl ester carboxylesterase